MKKRGTFLDAVKLVLTTHTNDSDRSPKSLLHLQLNSEAEVGFHPSPMKLKTEDRFALQKITSY